MKPSSATGDRLKGTVARIIPARGFFFIRGTDGAEYFAHATALEGGSLDSLQPQQTVTFVPTETAKGLRAEQVKRS